MKKLKNHKGISYVELILVIGIMVLVVGIVSLSVGLVNRNNVTKSVEKLDIGFKKAQAASMARGDKAGALVITTDGKNYYYRVGLDSTEKIAFAPSTCKIRIKVGASADDDDDLIINESNNFTILFKPTTGAVYKTGVYDFGNNTITDVEAYNYISVRLKNEDMGHSMLIIRETGKTVIN